MPAADFGRIQYILYLYLFYMAVSGGCSRSLVCLLVCAPLVMDAILSCTRLFA